MCVLWTWQSSWFSLLFPRNSVLLLKRPCQSVPWLHGYTSRGYNTILCLGHGTQGSLRCFVPQCSCGYFFLGSIPCDSMPIRINGTIHITCTILKLVTASTAEADLGALFLNAQEAKKVLRIVLEERGPPQPQTPIHINNTTTVGIIITPSNNSIHKP